MDIRIKNIGKGYIFTDLLKWIQSNVDKGYLTDFRCIDIWFTGVDYQHIYIRFTDKNNTEYTLYSYKRTVLDEDDISDTVLCKVSDTDCDYCFWGDIWEIDIEKHFNRAIEKFYNS